MKQIARNVTDEFDGFLKDYRYLTSNRNSGFRIAFRNALEREDVETVRCPPRVSTCYAYAEPSVRLITEEFLGRLILIGELLERSNVVAFWTDPAQRRSRLGGIQSISHRQAAE